jgi:hypothetical protein
MSETNPPPLPQRLPSQPGGGCGTVLMVLFGLILLLPGACAILFGIGSLKTGGIDSSLGGLIVFGLMLGAIGVLLLYTATKSQRR